MAKKILRFILILLIMSLVAFLAFMILYKRQALQPFRSAGDQITTGLSSIFQPTPTILPDPETILNDIRALARLETVEFTMEKVVTVETNQGILGPIFGDRLLFVGHGVIIAGVDLGKLGSEDLRLEDNTLVVNLPAPEIFSASLDDDKSYVYDRQTGFLTHGDPNLETLARQTAVEEMHKAALEGSILTFARQNAKSYLLTLFQSLGYPDVTFVE